MPQKCFLQLFFRRTFWILLIVEMRQCSWVDCSHRFFFQKCACVSRPVNIGLKLLPGVESWICTFLVQFSFNNKVLDLKLRRKKLLYVIFFYIQTNFCWCCWMEFVKEQFFLHEQICFFFFQLTLNLKWQDFLMDSALQLSVLFRVAIFPLYVITCLLRQNRKKKNNSAAVFHHLGGNVFLWDCWVAFSCLQWAPGKVLYWPHRKFSHVLLWKSHFTDDFANNQENKTKIKLKWYE